MIWSDIGVTLLVCGFVLAAGAVYVYFDLIGRYACLSSFVYMFAFDFM